MKPDLIKLTKKYVPNKRTLNYMPLYQKYLENKRDAKNVLEIGVLNGGSVRMWKEYFPNAQIYGVDILEKFKKHEEERIKIFIGDQGDTEFLKTLPDNLDVIIDDGSHKPQHMIDTFKYMFKHKLSKNGFYAVEDMLGYQHKVVVTFFMNLAHNINFRSKNEEKIKTVFEHYFAEERKADNTDDGWWDRNILGISFYRYICFIQKGHNPGDENFV